MCRCQHRQRKSPFITQLDVIGIDRSDFCKKIDVNNYISWKEGYLQFASEPLSNILKRLSRYYDTPIDCDNSIAQLKCNGKLVLFDNIEDVMKTIYNTIPIQYSHEAGRILVRKK